MSKINATYSSGYYIRPDMDIRKIEELKNKEKRETLKRQRDERAHEKKRKDLTMEELKEKRDDLIENIISGKHTKREARQTFAIPFDLFCTQCHRRIARQTHVYTDRYASPFPDPALRPTLTPEDQHLLFHTHKIRNVFLKIKCQYCDGLFLLETDNLTQKITGGYYCVKNCERPAGDVALLNNKRQHEENERQKQEKIEKEENVLDSLENENEKQRKRKLLEEEIKKSVEEQNNQHYYYTDVQKSALQLEALRKDENEKHNSEDNNTIEINKQEVYQQWLERKQQKQKVSEMEENNSHKMEESTKNKKNRFFEEEETTAQNNNNSNTIKKKSVLSSLVSSDDE